MSGYIYMYCMYTGAVSMRVCVCVFIGLLIMLYSIYKYCYKDLLFNIFTQLL